MRSVRFQPSARAELEALQRWYDEQAAPEVFERLLLELSEAVRRLEVSAHRFVVVAYSSRGAPIRSLRLARLPYALLYVIDAGGVVQVFAVPHRRRDRYWLKLVP